MRKQEIIGSPMWLILVALAMIGCASTPPTPKADFMPNEQVGVVVGRGLFVRDGQVILTDDYKNLLSPSITCHVSPFAGLDALNKNPWAPGKWMFSADTKNDGYFIGSLPVGTYYFVEYMYFDLVPPTGNMAATRSYTAITGSTIYRPFVATFEVLPGKTTYIGTMRHLYGSTAGVGYGAWGIEMKDELDLAKDWLKTRHPQLVPMLQSNVVKLQSLK